MISLPDFKMSRSLLLIAITVVTAQSDAGTYTEHKGVKCAEAFKMARFTVSALKVICPRDPKCHGFEVSGGRGKRCVGEVKFGDGSDDETLGMKGLKEDKKFSVFIKT